MSTFDREIKCTDFPPWGGVATVQWSRTTLRRTRTHTNTHGHAWITARIANPLEKPATNWLCNAKRKRRVLLPRNFKGPRWDAHLLGEIFYLDAAAAPRERYHVSRKAPYFCCRSFRLLHSLFIQSPLV